jgi:tRNA (adenine37-N6)-methyltransferase
VDEVLYRPIGVVHSPFGELAGMPLQSVAADDIEGTIEIEPEFAPGLQDIEGFSHLFVVSHLHRGKPGGLVVQPFLDDTPRGVFSTRSPRHPNPIGLSIVRLLSVTGGTLQVAGIDLVDGTPVLDLKPYVPPFDHVAAERIGWFGGRAADVHTKRADARFDRG